MNAVNWILSLLGCVFISGSNAKFQLPSFQKLKYHYPGYKRFGGRYTHRKITDIIGCDKDRLLHDTSALRLSYTLNKIGGDHSLGTKTIKLSTNGVDSVSGKHGLQYLYHPIAYGPFLVDKYGYPNISVLHQQDPVATKNKFWGKQGIIEILTYRKKNNSPKGHIALWDCDHIHQAKDWISKHSLITVEFWPSPDSDCSKNKKKNLIPFKPIPSRPLKYEDGRYSLRHRHRQSKLSKLLRKRNRVRSQNDYMHKT